MMGWVALALLVTGSAGIWRVLIGPNQADRMLGIQMLGTTGITLLLVLAQWLDQIIWRDVALVLALLAAVITAAFVQMLRGRPVPKADDQRQESQP